MKRNFDMPVLDVNGKPVRGYKINAAGQPEIDPATQEAVLEDKLLRESLASAIQGPQPGDDIMSFKKANEVWELAVRIAKGGDIELSADDLAIINERAPKYLTLVGKAQIGKILESEG